MIGCDCSICTSSDPRDRRLRASVLIATDDGGRLLVDAGPDLRTQALLYGMRRVDAILFTHGHADHILGLDDVRRFNRMQRQADALLRRRADPGGHPPDVLATSSTPRRRGAAACRRIELFDVDGPLLPRAPAGAAGAALARHAADPGVSSGRVRVSDRLQPHSGRGRGRCSRGSTCSCSMRSAFARIPTHFSLAEAVEAARRIGAQKGLFHALCHDLAHAATGGDAAAGDRAGL